MVQYANFVGPIQKRQHTFVRIAFSQSKFGLF
jgi:hypothetical protein